MRSMSKRAFAFRYIESLGQKIMAVQQTSLLKMYGCLTEKIGCPGLSKCQIFEACPVSNGARYLAQRHASSYIVQSIASWQVKIGNILEPLIGPF